MKLRNKIKQLLCKHQNKETKWIYSKGFSYNEHFDVAQTVRIRHIVCKDCGKVLNSILAEWISHDQIYQEVKEEYFKNA